MKGEEVATSGSRHFVEQEGIHVHWLVSCSEPFRRVSRKLEINIMLIHLNEQASWVSVQSAMFAHIHALHTSSALLKVLSAGVRLPRAR